MNYRIRELRTEKKLSQEALARLCGVSRITISGLESGRIQDTTSRTLKKIAEALDTSVDKLFG